MQPDLFRKTILFTVMAMTTASLVAPLPATGQTFSTPVVYLGGKYDTAWFANTLLAPKYRLGAQFRFTGDTAWIRAGDAVDFLDAGANPSTIQTGKAPLVKFPTQMEAYAQSTRTFALAPGPPPQYRADIVGNMVFRTLVRPPLPVEGEMWCQDPFGFTVGSVGSSLTFTQSLSSGTRFLRTELDPGLPNLNLDARFGIGSQFSPSEPETLWGASGPHPTAPPTNAFDLFNISITENAAGTGVSAIVSPNPAATLAGFDVLSNRTSSQIASLIDSAKWVRTGSIWTLQSNLDLYQIQLVNEATSNVGTPMVIGNFVSDGLDTSAVPEPSTLLFLLSSLSSAGLLAYRRRKA